MSTNNNVSTRPLLVEVEGLYYGYDGPQGRVSVLTGVSMEVRRSEFVAIVGPSGSGKSSLLYLLGGMERASQGRISVGGCDLGSMSDREIENYRQYNQPQALPGLPLRQLLRCQSFSQCLPHRRQRP